MTSPTEGTSPAAAREKTLPGLAFSVQLHRNAHCCLQKIKITCNWGVVALVSVRDALDMIEKTRIGEKRCQLNMSGLGVIYLDSTIVIITSKHSRV